MWEWLSKVSPDTVIAIVGGLYLYLRGEKTKDVQAILVDALRGEYAKIVEDPKRFIHAHQYLTNKAWMVLEELKIKKNKTTEKMVAALVTRAMTELSKELRTQLQLQKQLEQVFDRVVQLPKKFETPDNLTVPQLDLTLEKP